MVEEYVLLRKEGSKLLAYICRDLLKNHIGSWPSDIHPTVRIKTKKKLYVQRFFIAGQRSRLKQNFSMSSVFLALDGGKPCSTVNILKFCFNPNYWMNRDLDPYVNCEISFLLSFIGEINGKDQN